MDVNGVRSSWLTTETNSFFVRSTARRSVTSVNERTTPMTSPCSTTGAEA